MPSSCSSPLGYESAARPTSEGTRSQDQKLLREDLPRDGPWQTHNWCAVTASAPDLSVVVVAYCMARELPRTLQSLGAEYQTGIDDGQVEVLVVDNGSPDPLTVP